MALLIHPDRRHYSCYETALGTLRYDMASFSRGPLASKRRVKAASFQRVFPNTPLPRKDANTIAPCRFGID